MYYFLLLVTQLLQEIYLPFLEIQFSSKPQAGSLKTGYVANNF